jgi:PleD family two-component response regulator
VGVTSRWAQRAEQAVGPIGTAGVRAATLAWLEANPLPRILLVEDNEMNRDMLSRRLVRRGHVVSIATDGKEAIDTASARAQAIAESA